MRLFREFGFFDTWKSYSLKSAVHNLVFDFASWALKKLNGNNYRGLTVKLVDDFEGTGSWELLKFDESEQESQRNGN